MSQLKKIVQSPYFAATAGATALAAVLLAPTFDGARVANGPNRISAFEIQPFDGARVANGQQGATPSVPSESALPPIDASSPAAISANPNPLGIGIATPSAAVPGAVSAPNAPGTDDAAQLETLRARVRRLQSSLQRVPTTAEEQQAQNQIVAELTALTAQIQRIEATAGQFAAYRRARDVQAQSQNAGASPFAAPTFSGGYDGVSPTLGAAANPRPIVGLEPALDRQTALDASGLNASAAQAILAGAALGADETAFLREQKDALTRQYRQLQQTRRALQPGDDALAAALNDEETALLAQLKDVETQLAAASAAPNGADPNAVAAGNLPGALNSALPTPNLLPNDPSAVGDATSVAAKMEKASRAAALLREVGLVGLANHVANEVPNLANPNFVETQLVAGAWAEGSGLAQDRANPFQQISAQDVDAIQTSIDDLKTRVDSLAETLANVETQLKLLTRQTVAEPIATPTEPIADETEPAPTDENVENVENNAVGGSL